MAREYKFRGKSKEHGWVYGDLLQYPNGEVYIMEHSDGQDLSYPVDPDTVGSSQAYTTAMARIFMRGI